MESKCMQFRCMLEEKIIKKTNCNQLNQLKPEHQIEMDCVPSYVSTKNDIKNILLISIENFIKKQLE